MNVVPPQFAPYGASWDPNRSAGCTGPYPSSPTEGGSRFSKATPKGIPHPDPRCLAPTGSSLAGSSGYVLVFINVLWIYGLVYHFTLRKSNRKNGNNVRNLYLLFGAFVNGQRTSVFEKKSPDHLAPFSLCAIMQK